MIRILLITLLASAGMIHAVEPMPVWLDSETGTVRINDAIAVQDTTYTAKGLSLNTASASSATLVFANGTAIYCGENTFLQITGASWEPVSEMLYCGREYEDTYSKLTLHLHSGLISVSQPEPDARSTMLINMPQGSLEGNATAYLVEIGAPNSRAATIEGPLYYRAELGQHRRFIAEDEQINLTTAAVNDSADSIQPLRGLGNYQVQRLTERARLSRNRVLYDSTSARPAFSLVFNPTKRKQAAYNDYILPE